VILPFLRSAGIRRLEGVVISHRHRDHVGALEPLLDGIEVDRVFDAGFGSDRGTSGAVDRWLGSRGLWPGLVARGDTLHARQGAALIALHPPREDPLDSPPGGNLNDASLVVRIEDGPLRAVLCGDAEIHAETLMLEHASTLSAALLKVGHHGSRTSSSRAFLEAVHPRLAILSVGEGNRFGHPAPVTLETLARTGARIYRTDRDGTIWIRYRNGIPSIRTFPPRPREPAGPAGPAGPGCPAGTPLLESSPFGGEAGP
jgi:competence protein ComEC